jgi:hypothetical protein
MERMLGMHVWRGMVAVRGGARRHEGWHSSRILPGIGLLQRQPVSVAHREHEILLMRNLLLLLLNGVLHILQL